MKNSVRVLLFSFLFVIAEQLGNRLLEESMRNPKLAEDAQLCYICAGSFDKLVSSWMSKTTKSSEDIQELVELVSFLQKAVERQGRHVQVSFHKIGFILMQ